MTEFETSRKQAARLIALISIAVVPLLAGVAWAVGNPPLFALAGALVHAGVAALSLRAQPRTGRILAGLALTGQCIVLNAAMAGHPLQIDMHMVYFAVLASLVMMSGMRALLIAAATIAAHHLILTLLMPALVFPTTDLSLNMERTLVHAAVVVLEVAALAFTIRRRLQLNSQAIDDHARVEAAAEDARRALAAAEAEKTRAEAALAAAEEATRRADAARDAAEAARREAEENEKAVRAAEARTEAERNRHAEEARRATELLTAKLGRLADGDMTVRMTEDMPEAYVAGADAFNAAVERIAETLQDFRRETRAIQVQSGEITQAAGELSGRTERQASTLSGLASSLAKLTSLVRGIAEDAASARGTTEETRGRADSSGEVMTRALAAMDGIETSSVEVRKIINVIEDIAFQTNLLALNAGVEAARAGEAGRGFAVVATEVRALAARSSDAAREIDGLINASGAQISDGVRLVKQTGAELERIQSMVERIAGAMETIAGSTEMQSASLDQVNEAIAELDQVTQQNAAMFEETMSANSTLSDNAGYLAALVEQFDLGKRAADEGAASHGGDRQWSDPGGRSRRDHDGHSGGLPRAV